MDIPHIDDMTQLHKMCHKFLNNIESKNATDLLINIPDFVHYEQLIIDSCPDGEVESNDHKKMAGELLQFYMMHSGLTFAVLGATSPCLIGDLGLPDHGTDLAFITTKTEIALLCASQNKFWPSQTELELAELLHFDRSAQRQLGVHYTEDHNPLLVFCNLKESNISDTVKQDYNVVHRGHLIQWLSGNRFWSEFYDFLLEQREKVKHNLQHSNYHTPEDHQVDLLVKMSKVHKGTYIVNWACSLGKTLCMPRDIESREEIRRDLKLAPGLYIAMVPWLPLIDQQHQEFYTQCKENVKYVGFCSGTEIAHGDYFDKHGNMPVRSVKTLNEDTIVNMVQTRTSAMVVFVTQKSISRLYQAFIENDIAIDTDYLDEVHRLVPSTNSPDTSNLENIGADILSGPKSELPLRRFGFTATMSLNSKSQYSMDNTALFGTIIDRINHRKGMNLGKILGIDAYITRHSGWVDDDEYVSVVSGAIKQCHAIANKENKRSNVLAFLKDARNMKSYSKTLKSRFPDTDIFYITGDTPTETREQRKAAFAKSNKSVLLSCNTLTEGISIDNVTDVIVGRGMEEKSFIQAISRGTRILRVDRELFRSGKLSVDDSTGWNKYRGRAHILCSDDDDVIVEECATKISLMMKHSCLCKYFITSIDKFQATDDDIDAVLMELIDDLDIKQKVEDAVQAIVLSYEQLSISAEFKSLTRCYENNIIGHDEYIEKISVL